MGKEAPPKKRILINDEPNVVESIKFHSEGEHEGEDFVMDKKRILIVDDEKDIVESIQFRLEFEGFECMVAFEGETALIKAKGENPDLVLLDIMLPKINGYKIARLLKFDEAYKNIPIIMLTARAQKADIALGEETGADEYVTKPFDMDELVNMIRKYLKNQ